MFMAIPDLAQKLVQFESTHEKPAEIDRCLEFCIAQFSGLPVSIERYRFEGHPMVVISNRPGKNFDVLLLGHVDTVPGKPELFEGRIHDGKLYGRGTLDMKAFVATSITLLQELIAEDFAGSVALAIVSDEELGGTFGAKKLAGELGYQAKVVLVPDDGENIQMINNATKHILQIRFQAVGKESHAARPWNGINALDLLFTTYQNLRAHFPTFDTTPDDDWVSTMNLGKLSGGTATNEVAGEAEMLIDIRFVAPLSRDEVLARLDGCLSPGVSYEILMEGYPTNLDRSHPYFQSYAKSIESVTGHPAEERRSGGGTDGRYFTALGMPTIVHQGTGGLCQTDEEHVVLETLPQLVAIQKRFILESFGKAS